MLDFYTQRYPVAQKEHECEYCHCIIPKGKRYSYETGKFDGDMFVRKLCPECRAILNDYCNENSDEEFDWWEVSDWLSDIYCSDCQKRENCDCIPEQCDLIKGEFPSEIPPKLYEVIS